MFYKVLLIAIPAILPALLVVADVTPTSPGPGYVADAGSNCMIEWTGDTSSPTAWKSMSIQLMTGDNFNMIPLTTVVQNLDGTKSGSFVWTCPQVTPNSAIYFYQFTSPNTANREWTTRFTIASSSGKTTPPPNPTQPGTGQAIPWGTGSLNDPSSAVPPPAYLSGGSSSSAPASSSPASSSPGSPTPTNPSATNPTSPGQTSATSPNLTPTVSSSLSPGTTTALTNVGLSTTPSLSTTIVVAETTPGAIPSTTILPTSKSNSAAPYNPFVPSLLLSICAPIIMALF